MTDTLTTVPDGAHLMPSGNWVTLRDPRELTRGDKKQLVRQANREGLSAIDSGYEVYEQLMAKLVTGWSYPFPLPSEQTESLDAIPVEDDNAMSDLIEPARQLLFPKTEVTPDDHGDPASPSAPSSD